MVESVHNLIAAAQQGDREALANLTAQFDPCLKSVARTVPCDDSYEELRLFLLELLLNLDLPHFVIATDGAIVSYVITSLKNRGITLKKQKSASAPCLYYEDLPISVRHKIDVSTSTLDVYDEGLLDLMHRTLNSKEFSLLFLHYYRGKSISEIAKAWNISRQAVNAQKHRALRKLRNAIQPSG